MAVMLSQRADGSHLVRVSCCEPRYYDPADLLTLIGDVPVLALGDHMAKCETCGSRNFIRVRLVSPTGAERARIKVRRLVEIRLIKRPVWRYE